MGKKTILLEPSKCTGCGDCETACSVKRTGIKDPSHSCVHIISDENGFCLPIICMHCSAPPCQAVCPKEAIYRDHELNRVMIDSSRCIGCKMCFAACPFGAMGFDEDQGLAFKCDLCGGDPECVKCCEPMALTYVESLQLPQVKTSAEKFFEAMRPRAA